MAYGGNVDVDDLKSKADTHKDELVRFCDAMIAIRAEIAEVESGEADKTNNILRNAPHTHHALLEGWDRPYSREQDYFPLPSRRDDKFWPPVARVDNVYGDRNLVSACPSLEDCMEAVE